jgi:hypothetical protein
MGQPTKTDLGRDPVSGQPENPRDPDGDRNATTAVTGAVRAIAAPDAVDAWGADSFPASDPPGWWAGR